MSKFSFDRAIGKWDCKVVEKRKTWFIISISIILVGAIVAAIFGFNVGIDFSGGSVLSVTVGDFMDNDARYEEYRTAIYGVLENHGISPEVAQRLTSEEHPGVQFRYQNKINGANTDETTMFELNNTIKVEIETAVREVMLNVHPNASESLLNGNLVIQLSNVGATASAELLLNAFISVLVAAALILVYVAIRFELLSGLSAVIALVHDISIMIAFMAIFRIQINAPFVAALITIVGYSINNTIVLFDRVRENRQLYSMRDATPTALINTSIKDTLTRSINTSLTTMVTIVLLAILGVSQIQEFALPIIIGLIAGTYSSIFIAPPLWVVLKNVQGKKGKKGNSASGKAAVKKA